MIRKYLAALVALALCVGVFGTAWAQVEWVTKPIGWALTSQGGPQGPTSIFFRDTTKNVIAAGQTDTTWHFVLEHLADISKPVSVAADTMELGYLVFAQDSAGATAANVTSITVEIDGAITGAGGVTVGQNGPWKQLDSLVVAQTPFDPDEQGALVIPIRTRLGTHGNYDPGGVAESPKPKMLALGFDTFRARITAATGVMTAAKAFVRYRKNVSGSGSRSQ